MIKIDKIIKSPTKDDNYKDLWIDNSDSDAPVLKTLENGEWKVIGGSGGGGSSQVLRGDFYYNEDDNNFSGEMLYSADFAKELIPYYDNWSKLCGNVIEFHQKVLGQEEDFHLVQTESVTLVYPSIEKGLVSYLVHTADYKIEIWALAKQDLFEYSQQYLESVVIEYFNAQQLDSIKLIQDQITPLAFGDSQTPDIFCYVDPRISADFNLFLDDVRAVLMCGFNAIAYVVNPENNHPYLIEYEALDDGIPVPAYVKILGFTEHSEALPAGPDLITLTPEQIKPFVGEVVRTQRGG